jgi:hypothetical protein
MLESDPAFEKSLLNKAKKQQDLVVMSYDSDGTTLYCLAWFAVKKVAKFQMMASKRLMGQ